jgi:hypothetical protein
MIFDSKINVRGYFQHVWSDEIVKNEPMFFNCDLDFAHKHGGPITQDFIERLPLDWVNSNPVLDSRVHMLMPNWYPCIPGWHHDDVPRSTATGQPNYVNPEYRSEHLCGLVNADICPTEFLLGEIEVSDPDINTRVYNVMNDEVELLLPSLEIYKAESGKYIEFNCDTFHTGVKANAGGWRWFIRLSRKTDRTKNITNEIRRQVQVYLEEPMAGW